METGLFTCGIDVHYKKSSFCILNTAGKTIAVKEVSTDKDEINSFLSAYKSHPVQYAFEAGGMAHYLNDILSHQSNTWKIHVVHPYKFKIISESNHKTDKSDSINLARALYKDFMPYPVFMKSCDSRYLKSLLMIRKRKVRNQAKIINQAKAIMRSMGVHVKTQSLKTLRAFSGLLNTVDQDSYEYRLLNLLHDDFTVEHTAIQDIEQSIEQHIEKTSSDIYTLLMTIPGIGPITAATLIATIDTIKRFPDADRFSSYLGLVPSEKSSGEKIQHGSITKEGQKEARSLLIQAAWCAVRSKREDPRMQKLRQKYYRISQRGVSQKAIVPIARHLTRIIYGIWKSGIPYSGQI